MHRHAIDRWADTTLFRLALVFASLAVVPVLLMGVSTTVIGAAGLLAAGAAWEVDPGQAAVALLSVGGALGFAGYLRAHWAAKDPCRHNITATLVFVVAGVIAALSVAGFVSVTAVAIWLAPSGSGTWLALGAAFAAANLVWAIAGIASMQRLLRRYAEITGEVFDDVPVMLLCLALALATAAALATVTL